MSNIIGRKVKVYRNLHKDSWSLMAADGPERGRVIGYADQVELDAPELRVGEASRQRAVREGVRNVHAFVVGTLLPNGSIQRPLYRVRYNPFRASCFHTNLGTCVFSGGLALLDQAGTLWMDVSPDTELLLARVRAQLAERIPEAELERFFLTHRQEIEQQVQAQLGRMEMQ